MDQRLFDECEKCMQDEPAASTARCPIHIDVASFNAEMEKGYFKKAYKILQKRMPFAGIIGMICDHPCESACVRGQLDSKICISELERAAVSYGYETYKNSMAVPKKNGKVAVIGGGISGLSVACDLDKKGFEVTIYEKSDRLGGHIWSFEGRLIEKDKIEEELKIVKKLGISVVYNHKVGLDELKVISEKYDAVYLGTGDWPDTLSIDMETFQVFSLPVFAGGRLYNKNDSVIYSVSIGKRAALSIERYIKKISLVAARDREGSFETPMKYNMDDVLPSPKVEKTQDIYTQEEAVREAKRCLKCHCNECTKACSHLRKFDVTPKSYGRQIQINENVIMGTRYANKMINSCTMCGLCSEKCQSGIGMKDLIGQTRESMVEKGKMPISAHNFALKDMEFSNSSHFFTVKSPPPIPEDKLEARKRELITYPRITFSKYAQSIFNGDPPGEEKADYMFYPGCQLSASYPEYVEQSYAYLVSKIKEGVGLMLGCCGAPADWGGRQDLMTKNIEKLRNAWIEKGKPTFILACSSCSAVFSKYLPEISYVSLWEMFESYGLPETVKAGGGHILTVHDACSARHNNKLQDSLRHIAESLGYEIREPKYTKKNTKCCGYGGLVYYANREQANDFVLDRINESDEDFLVYCAMCKDLFVSQGKRTFHILDLVFGNNLDETALKEMPNLSERHANRANLKKKLLKEFWNEDQENDIIQMKNLIIPDAVWLKMEERYILLEDVDKVIKHSKETGERFLNPNDGTYLANNRVGDVTFWVQYSENHGEIHVLSVYSHRMEVQNG